MMHWPSNPRFRADPLGWLVRAGREPGVRPLGPAGDDGDGGVDSTGGPGDPVYAAFGAQAAAAVLGDLATFGMPRPLAERHGLPPVLANLNSALFSMTGQRHREHRRLLASVLSPADPAGQQAAIERGVTSFARDLAFDADFPALDQARRLARLVALEVLLGLGADQERVGLEIQRLFELRRIANTRATLDPELRSALVDQGTDVDAVLRELVSERRRRPTAGPRCVLSDLVAGSTGGAGRLGDDELVAHANILFMSSSEPIATALAWTLLAVTQQPALVAAVRRELTAVPDRTSPLLMGLVKEVLRLVPPSAVLIRVAQADTALGGHHLTAGQAVLVAPYVEHRRESAFTDATAFRPSRWDTARPAPYEFLPFGGGARACLGRRTALATLHHAVRAVVLRGDVVVPTDQVVDWRLNVTLQPHPDPTLRLVPAGALTRAQHGGWSGPSAELLPTASAVG